MCFLLEHLAQPVEALRTLAGLVRPGGTVTVIEGDHGSAYFHPDSAAAHDAIRCQVELQRRAGGDAEIGRRVYPLMVEAGVKGVRVSPRMVYVDASRPELVDGFTHRTFTAMIEGVREDALQAGLIAPERFDAGIAALYRHRGLLLRVLQGRRPRLVTIASVRNFFFIIKKVYSRACAGQTGRFGAWSGASRPSLSLL